MRLLCTPSESTKGLTLRVRTFRRVLGPMTSKLRRRLSRRSLGTLTSVLVPAVLSGFRISNPSRTPSPPTPPSRCCQAVIGRNILQGLLGSVLIPFSRKNSSSFSVEYSSGFHPFAQYEANVPDAILRK